MKQRAVMAWTHPCDFSDVRENKTYMEMALAMTQYRECEEGTLVYKFIDSIYCI